MLFYGPLPGLSQAMAVDAPAPAGLLSIDDATSYAIQHNPAFAAVQAAADRQFAVVEQVKAGLHPTVSGSSTAGHGLSEEASTGVFGVRSVSHHDSLFLGVSGVLPVDISGELHTAVNQAEFQAVASRCAVAAARNDLIAATRDNYIAALRAQDTVVATRHDLENANVRLKEAQTQVDAGTMAKFELDRAMTAVAAAKNVVFAAEQGADLALARLRNSIGMAQGTPLAITEAGAGDAEKMSLPQQVRVQRPEVLQAQAEVAAAEKGFRLAKQSMRPTFYFAGDAGHTPITSFIGHGINTVQITANMVIPFYDGGVSHALVKQAAASNLAAQDQLESTKQEVDLEVREAELRLQNALTRLPISETALVNAKESYRLAQLRFTEGEAPQIEVTDAQGALTQAQADIISARWDVLAAKNAYTRAIGGYAMVGAHSP